MDAFLCKMVREKRPCPRQWTDGARTGQVFETIQWGGRTVPSARPAVRSARRQRRGCCCSINQRIGRGARRLRVRRRRAGILFLRTDGRRPWLDDNKFRSPYAAHQKRHFFHPILPPPSNRTVRLSYQGAALPQKQLFLRSSLPPQCDTLRTGYCRPTALAALSSSSY